MKIHIDKTSSTPLYIQLKESIKDLITGGHYTNGDHLPTTRMLADTLGIHRNTVITAYKALEAEGYAYSHVGRGTFVVKPDRLPAGDKIAFYNIFDWTQHLSEKLKQRISHKLLTLYQSESTRVRISFVWSQRGLADFPIQKFQRSMNSVLRKKSETVFDYTRSTGDFNLRSIIANHLRMKGIKISPENILIVAGAQQAIDLVGRLLLEPGDGVVVENPTYTGALCSFQFLQAKIIGIPVDDWGMKVHLLEDILVRYRPKFIFTIPTFHNPTGATMRNDRRESIVSLAEKYQIPIVEDDYGSDLQFSGPDVPLLKALDVSGQVIYIGTFSKLLMPGLRVGWIAASRDVIEPLTELKRYADLCTSPFLQAAITEFHARGYMATHLRYLRRVYQHRLQILIDAIKRYFPSETTLIRPDGGIYLWITLPKDIDLKRAWDKALKRGVAFSLGSLFYLDENGSNQMRLRFVSVEEDKIWEGIRIIGEEIAKCKISSPS